MWSWLSWLVRSSFGRRLLVAGVGMLVRRRVKATMASLTLLMSGGDDHADEVTEVDDDADDADDEDGGSRTWWPVVVLGLGALAGWWVYRWTRHDDREVPEWTPLHEPTAPSASPAMSVTDGRPTTAGVDDRPTPSDGDAPDDTTSELPRQPAAATDDEPVGADATDAGDADLTAGEAALGRSLAVDDLKAVEGIGPKIEEVLNGQGIGTWHDLASADPDRLREILDDAGPRYRMHDPGSWPEQAALLNRGDWQQFAELTGRLSDGTA